MATVKMSTEKMPKAKKALSYFGENATTHGVSAICNAKNLFGKAVIFTLFLGLFVSMIASIIYTFRCYLEYRVYTSVEIEEQYNIPFPSVTICRNNVVSRAHTPGSLVEEIMQKASDIETGKIPFSDINQIIVNLTYEILASVDDANQTISQTPAMILSTLSDSCMFAESYKCNISRDFKPTFPSVSLDRCYTFHGGDELIYTQSGAGPKFGLKMTLYVNQSDYLPLVGTEHGAGFTVYIHERETLPFMGIRGLLVAPGFSTKIALKMTEVISKSAPFPTNCTDGKDVLNYVPGEYSSLSCHMSCVYHEVYKKCGYVDPVIRNQMKAVKLRKTTASMLKCRENVFTEVMKGRNLQCRCPRACREISYETVVSQSRWPVDIDFPIYKALSKNVIGLDSSNITDEFFHKNFLKLNIYFDEMDVRKYVEKEMVGKNDLLSNIGGHLGLWTGSSLFSIFELSVAALSLILFLVQTTAKKMSPDGNIHHDNSKVQDAVHEVQDTTKS